MLSCAKIFSPHLIKSVFFMAQPSSNPAYNVTALSGRQGPHDNNSQARHERKGHYLPFVNKPPVSGQFLPCQLRQSMTNPSCFESRLWSVSSFNAPCHPYNLWRFSSGSLRHDILLQRAGKALSHLAHVPQGPGNMNESPSTAPLPRDWLHMLLRS